MSTSTAPTCTVVRGARPVTGEQGLSGFAGVAAEMTGARGLCMHLVTFPPGGRAVTHRHKAHETAISVLSGTSEMWYGEGLREHLTVAAGEFLSIPADVPHLHANASATEPCTAVLARTDPNEQESVLLMPELELDGVPPPAAG